MGVALMDTATQLTAYDLIVFDLDGTLSEWKTGEILPGVASYFDHIRHQAPTRTFAIASNQGGVGLRHWMTVGGWGEPETLPTQQDIETLIAGVMDTLGLSPDPQDGQLLCRLYTCFAYISKKGRSNPYPPDLHDDPRWQPENRKPAPGMLIQAMADAGVSPDKTLMVGDRSEDRFAAERAGCYFVLADEFFGRALR